MRASVPASRPGSLTLYLAEINRCPLLDVREEQRLARRAKAGDRAAARRLVTANLRFVVKVAYEYRSYGLRMGDLIQEGNLGLMKAVEKFDPEKQIRLISYGVWWIRAFIQNHILKSWSLVKIGTTQAQRKLFFSLSRTRRELERLGQADDELAVARKLRVKPTEVAEMRQRLEGRDLSLDAPVGEPGGASFVEFLPAPAAAPDDALDERASGLRVRDRVGRALARLDVRERFIIEQRLMNDRPMTLKELGEHFGFSRERARQLEIRAREKLRAELEAALDEADRSQAA